MWHSGTCLAFDCHSCIKIEYMLSCVTIISQSDEAWQTHFYMWHSGTCLAFDCHPSIKIEYMLSCVTIISQSDEAWQTHLYTCHYRTCLIIECDPHTSRSISVFWLKEWAHAVINNQTSISFILMLSLVYSVCPLFISCNMPRTISRLCGQWLDSLPPWSVRSWVIDLTHRDRTPQLLIHLRL